VCKLYHQPTKSSPPQQHPITLTVINPIGNLVSVAQVTANANGDFSAEFNTASTLWKMDGPYIITAQVNPTTVFKTQVKLVGGIGQRTECLSSEIQVNADNFGIYCIPVTITTADVTGVDGFLNTESKTLLLEIRGSSFGYITIDLPTYILDSQLDNGDRADYIISVNGDMTEITESNVSPEGSRTLTIPFPLDAAKGSATIEITGTSVVPEFGLISMLILVIAISVIVVISSQRSFRKIIPV